MHARAGATRLCRFVVGVVKLAKYQTGSQTIHPVWGERLLYASNFKKKRFMLSYDQLGLQIGGPSSALECAIVCIDRNAHIR